MTEHKRYGRPFEIFYAGEPRDRSDFFTDHSAGAGKERCQLCNERIKRQIGGGNVLARSSHLAKHVRAGHLVKIGSGDYKVTESAPRLPDELPWTCADCGETSMKDPRKSASCQKCNGKGTKHYDRARRAVNA